jgi:hypothetical protein
MYSAENKKTICPCCGKEIEDDLQAKNIFSAMASELYWRTKDLVEGKTPILLLQSKSGVIAKRYSNFIKLKTKF